MTQYPRMKVLQPDPFDLVDQRVQVAGDTLSGIAQEAYGDASLFLRVFAANRNQLSDPNLVRAGQQLRVPLGNQI